MTRMNPLRRLAATAAIVGVTAFGAVALASPASAEPGGAPAEDTTAVAPVGEVALPSLDSMTVGDLMGSLKKAPKMTIKSPKPDGPVVIDIAHFTVTYTPDVAQTAQTVIANFYGDLGYQVAFSKKHVLVIGAKICDPTKSDKANKGCVDPDSDTRF
jgi:hypothetical protein